MRNLLVLGALAAATASPALAQEVTVSGNVTLTTDYAWRNVSQSNMDWAIQGGLDLATETGFYAGVWASTVDFNDEPEDTNLEIDVYGGYGFEAAGLGFDVGFIYYAYPDAGTADYDFYEIYGGISKDFDNVSLSGMLSIDPDNETTYLDLGASVGLSESFSLAAGYGTYLDGFGEYSGWNFGGTWSVGGVDLGVTYYDNDTTGDNDNIIFSIGKAM